MSRPPRPYWVWKGPGVMECRRHGVRVFGGTCSECAQDEGRTPTRPVAQLDDPYAPEAGMQLTIKRIEVLRQDWGADRVALHTTLPEATDGDDHLILTFNVRRGLAEAYVAEHFPGVTVTVQDLSKGVL